jgi:hypothetical protein
MQMSSSITSTVTPLATNAAASTPVSKNAHTPRHASLKAVMQIATDKRATSHDGGVQVGSTCYMCLHTQLPANQRKETLLHTAALTVAKHIYTFIANAEHGQKATSKATIRDVIVHERDA